MSDGCSSGSLVGWVNSRPLCTDGLERSVDDMGEGDKMRFESLHISVLSGALISLASNHVPVICVFVIKKVI